MSSTRFYTDSIRMGLGLFFLLFSTVAFSQDIEEGGRFVTEKDWVDWDKAIVKPDTVRKLIITEDEGFDITRLKEFKQLKGLILYDYPLKDLGFVADLPKLTVLELSGNSLPSLAGIDTLKQLREFVCASNFIQDLSPLYGMAALRQLKLPENDIADISGIAHMTQLVQLDLGGNPITTIAPIAHWQQLKSFSVYRCSQLTDVSPVANWTGLEDLNLSFLEIPGFSLSLLGGLTNLRSLRVQGVVQSNEELQHILQNTRLEQLTMGKNDNVTNIDSLYRFPNLRYLDIHSNNVKDLYVVRNFPKLVKLVAYRNQIADISPLLGCYELRSLFVQGNPVVDYSPLYQMGYLQHLNVNKQHFDAAQQSQLKRALRTTSISFE
jgi:internalin A